MEYKTWDWSLNLLFEGILPLPRDAYHSPHAGLLHSHLPSWQMAQFSWMGEVMASLYQGKSSFLLWICEMESKPPVVTLTTWILPGSSEASPLKGRAQWLPQGNNCPWERVQTLLSVQGAHGWSPQNHSFLCHCPLIFGGLPSDDGKHFKKANQKKTQKTKKK